MAEQSEGGLTMAESSQWLDAKVKSEKQRTHCCGTLFSDCGSFL